MIVSSFVPFPQGHRTTRLLSESQMIRESLFSINNHIYRSIQLIILIPNSIVACHDLTTHRTILPFHNTMIVSVSYIDRLIIIDIKIP
jgi:hypothetical protein